MATRSGTLLRRIITILQQLLWKDLKHGDLVYLIVTAEGPYHMERTGSLRHSNRKSETFQPEVQDIPTGSQKHSNRKSKHSRQKSKTAI